MIYLKWKTKFPMSSGKFETKNLLSEAFCMSLTAAASRCVERDVTPSAIAFCKDDKVKWSGTSESLQYRYLCGSNFPDSYSGAGECFEGGIDHQISEV